MSLSRRLPLATLILACCLGSAMAQSSPTQNPPHLEVGCQHLVTPEGIELGIWYPSADTPTSQALGPYAQECVINGPVRDENHALIVISHGTGGSWTSHLDTAAALARAGYVVAALTEPGDNWHDTAHASDLVGRTRAMSAALTYMLSAWPLSAHLDQNRIGAFGFSAGGLTALLAVGARPDLTRVAPWCALHAASFTCTLLHKRTLPTDARLPSVQDTRFKAMVIAAPALGFTMTRASLAPVTLPVQLWQAMNDAILPSPGSVEPVRDNLPSPPEFHAVSGAGHFDFLAPCRAGYEAMAICQSLPGFDRAAFHAVFNKALTGFYDRTLLNSQKSGSGMPGR
ncbi:MULTISPECIES: prolyl oligopeptidase family serine peptidase [unclassified Asaia]|uniref:alpha/beta hydrolase family protein n=1 Tax=unclassified Asaia TaxID=2685023 RepID=UPI0018F41D8C|nr:prolyl oligopeptidase family serine peptidase [Asaia sp. W19]